MKIYKLSQQQRLIDKVAAIYLKEWRWHLRDDWNISDLQEMKQDIIDNYLDVTYVGVNYRNEMVGTFAILTADTEKQDEFMPWLSCVYVDTEIGETREVIGQFVNFAVKQVEDMRLYLWCYDRDEKILYESLGFECIDDMPYFEGRAYVMALSKKFDGTCI